MRRPFGILILAVTLAAPAEAQRIVGAITDRATRGEVSGAVVSLLDTNGKSMLRAISDAHGKYDVPWLANTARLQIIRIGFRPLGRALPATSPHDTTIDITMDRLPTLLDTIVIAGKQLCGDSPARRDAARLWDQARAALLGAIVARETQKATSIMLGYSRSFLGNVMAAQEEKLLKGSSSTPYASGRNADEFAAGGYRMSTAVSDTYYGPDADVLFDDSFGFWHCFATTRDPAKRPGLVGLTFEPRRDKTRDALVEIAGTLWIDAAAAALVELEFEFTNVTRPRNAPPPGGVVHFRTMPNGIIFIDNWTLLYPSLGLGGLSETGGEVLQSDWPDGTHYQAPVTEIRGVVRERGTGAPLPGVIVLRRGMTESVLTDSSGEYLFAPIAPGRYDVRALDTALDVIRDARTDVVPVEVSRGAAKFAGFELESRQAILDGVCKGHRSPSTVSLAGRLDDRSGQWPDGLRVIIPQRDAVDADQRGRFQACGIAANGPASLRATAGRSVLADTTVVVTARPVQLLNWRLLDGSLFDLKFDRARELIGRVDRADGTPVVGANVWAVNGGMRATTDSGGMYLLKPLRLTPQILRVSAPGFAPLIDTVTARVGAMRPGHVIRLEAADSAAVSSLSASWRSGFTDRLRSLNGTFADDADLRPLAALSVPALLASSPFGLRVVGQSAQRFVASADDRFDQVGLGGNKDCYVAVVIDGFVVYRGGLLGQPPDLARLHVADVAAVEVYGRGVNLPLRYSTSAGRMCGTVVLWLRTG